MKRRTILWLITLSFSTCSNSLLFALENATLPYSVVHKMLTLGVDNTAGNSEKTPNFSLTSSLDGVGPEDIKIYINSNSGRILIPLNPDKSFTLPIKKSLIAEDPLIITNQPKGSMYIQAVIGVESKVLKSSFQPQESKIRYSTLFVLEKAKSQLINELNALEEKGYSMKDALSTPPIVEFTPKKGKGKPTIMIEAKEGPIRVFPNRNGEFILSYTPGLMKEDPWIYLSKSHEWNIQTRVNK